MKKSKPTFRGQIPFVVPTKDDLFYARPHSLIEPKLFVFGSIGIHIISWPYYIYETGKFITVEQIYNPDYKPCLAVDSKTEGVHYIYNYTDDTLKRFKSIGKPKYRFMDINVYYKLTNWMIKNLPCRNQL